MWFFSIYKYIMFGLKQRSGYILIFHPICYIKLKVFFLKKFLHYFYVRKHMFLTNILAITFETKLVSIKYAGKIFRVEKKKQAFNLVLNYTGFTYLIWKDLKIRFKKRRKRYYFTLNTIQSLRDMFHKNLVRLRILNAYTKRGLYCNLFYYYARERKLSTTR